MSDYFESEHKTHLWLEYLFAIKFLKIFRFTRWISSVQDGVNNALESPSLKNIKNNVMNLLNLFEIMIMIIIAVGFNVCIWARNSNYLYHQNVKIYANSITTVFKEDSSFELTNEKFL